MPINSFDDYPMSWKPSITREDGPIYKTLANLLEEDIKSKRLLPGTKLPPQRELADYLDINLSTVSRAFKLCEQKGLICASVGNGTFVATDAGASNIIHINSDSMQIIEMGAILPNAQPNRQIIDYMQKMLTEPDIEKLFQYGNTEYTPSQKEAAVRWIKKTEYEVTPDQILFSSGGQNALAAILSSLFKAGDKIGTDPLTYPGIKTVAKMLGIQLIPIDSVEEEMTEEGLISACKHDKIKGIYIIPDFHNPTTKVMSVKTRKMIANVAERFQLIVIEDAINSLLMENLLPPVAVFAPEHTIYILSLSKIISPGLRMAYIVTPDCYHKELATGLYNLNITVSPFLSELASRLIYTGKAESIAKERREFTKQQNEIVNRELKHFKLRGQLECPFRWIELPEIFTGRSFEICAKNEGVQVFSNDRFLVGNTPTRKAIRISVTATRNQEEFERGIKILKRILESEVEADQLL